MIDRDSPTRTLLRSTLLLLLSGLAISCLLGWLIYHNNRDNRLDNILQQQEVRLVRAQVLFSREIGDMVHTIRLLHKVPSLSAALASDQTVNRALANELFISFANSVSSLMQVRWIDRKGMEKVRVNVQDGTPVVVPSRQLQNKSNRYYIQQGLKTPEGKVYLSGLDLNIEHGTVEIPYRPTIRVLQKTGPESQLHAGLLVLNYDIGRLLTAIRTLDSELVQLQLVDHNGDWIMHPDAQLEWGQSLQMPGNNMQKMQPELWQQLQKDGTARGSETASGLASYKCTDLVEEFTQNTGFSQGSRLCFIAMTPKQIITRQKWLAAWPGLLTGFVIFMFGCWVLQREQRAGMRLIHLNRELAYDKKQLEESAEYTQTLLKQQHILQNDLVESSKLSALGMMVAGVAHELNTPLGAAIMAASKQRTEHNRLAKSFHSGLTKSALERYLTDSEQGLDLIEENQRRAAELIRSFKRLAIDRAREEVISFSLDQVINDLMKTLHHRLKVAHVKTELKVPDISMSGTPGILSQVVQNLVMNVIHHAFEPELGGKLTISAALIGEQVELRVSDNGKGIAPDLLPTLFDPFVTSKRSHGNTGLGMHFVHQWVTRSLKGSIAVETEPDKGTTFVLTIPQQVQLNLPED